MLSFDFLVNGKIFLQQQSNGQRVELTDREYHTYMLATFERKKLARKLARLAVKNSKTNKVKTLFLANNGTNVAVVDERGTYGRWAVYTGQRKNIPYSNRFEIKHYTPTKHKNLTQREAKNIARLIGQQNSLPFFMGC